VPIEGGSQHVQRLEGALRDIVALLALPVLWTGKAVHEVLEVALDAFRSVLPVDFVLVQATRRDEISVIERASFGHGPASEAQRVAVREAVRQLGCASLASLVFHHEAFGRTPLHLTVIPLGSYGGRGYVVFGARRAGFPDALETSVLRTATSLLATALDAAELLTQTREAQSAAESAAEVTSRIAAFTSALASALTPEQVARVAAASGRAMLRASASFAWLLSDGGDSLLLVAADGASSDAIPEYRRIPRDAQLPPCEVMRTLRPLLIESEQELAPFPALKRMPLGFAAWYAVPLVANGQALGGLVLGFEEPRRFEYDPRMLLDAIAAQSSVALERSTLFDAERRLRQRALRLQEITAAIATCWSLDDVAKTMLRFGAEALKADWTLLALTNGSSIDTIASGPVPKSVLAQCGRTAGALDSPVVASLRTGVAIWLESEQERKRYPALDCEEAPAALVVAPLLSDRTAIGACAFGYAAERRFSEGDREFVHTAMRICAQALERARLYESERRAREEAERTVHFNEMFAGMLGHDLRNPLASVLTATQLVLRRTDDPRTVTPMRRILNSGARMGRMIDQLLDLTRARAGGGITLQRTPTDLSEVIKVALDEVRGAKPEASIQLLEKPSARGVWDSDRLLQVFSNLVSNAVQHGSGSQVQVSLDGSDCELVQVEIRNAGAVSKDILPILFDPFRGVRHKRDGSQGLGLGLFISQQIVTAHGGQIVVESCEEAGTCFRVRLPRGAEPS
jgi:signal transduction histidine kinase